MRRLLLSMLFLAPASVAMAQGFQPLSGPNTAIPSPVCDIINFGFCPQPPPPAPLFPDPNDVAVARPAPVPVLEPAPPLHRRHHGRRHHTGL